MLPLKHNFFQLLIVIDQFFNVLLGMIFCPHRQSWADETLSSRAHRLRLSGKPLMANCIDKILFFDKNHCEESYISERKGRQLPPELR